MTAEIVSLAAFRASGRRDRTYGGTSLLAEKVPQERANGLAAMLPRHEQRWSDHRDEPRHPVRGKCTPALTLEGVAAKLENVSRNGLMATADLAAGLGSRVLVSLPGGRSLSARVIWKCDGLVGLEVPIGSMDLRVV